MNVLIFGAHPDDIEILCGGTSAKYVRLGHQVTHCVLTDGQVSSKRIGNEELIEVRRAEAKAAADVIGADLVHFDIRDELLFDNEENRLRVLEVILTVRPEVIVTHSDRDYARDHIAAHDLVLAVAPMSVLSNCYSELPPLERHPAVFLMDTVSGVDFLPTEFVDISEDFETKVKAFLCHASQVQAFEDVGHDLTEVVRTHSRFRGLQAGATYAEGFQKLRNWYSGATERYLP